MTRVNVIVEGHAEETFVRTVLVSALSRHGIYLFPRRVETGRKRRRIDGRTERRIHRGGLISYAKVRADIQRWLKQERGSDIRFTTMFDLYALPDDFPAWSDAQKQNDPYKKATVLEEELAADLADARFVPYIQLHEFETLLFADIGKLSVYYTEPGYSSAVRRLVRLADSFQSPELIDDGEHTAPSKRIGYEIPEYLDAKRTVGPLITEEIGLAVMRKRCPHFSGWIEALEGLV